MKPISDTVSVSRQATSSLLALASPVAAGVLPAAVLITFAAPFLAMMFYSIPAYDDFCKAALVEFNGVPQPGVVALAWTHYRHSSPRWLTTFIQGVLMSKVDLFGAYGWLLLAVVGITVASLWYFVHTFLDASPRRCLLITALFYSAWMASITTSAEALFWVTGATEYYLPLSALLVLVSLLYRFRGATWQYLVVAFLSFAIPALHEIAGTLLCAIALAGFICTRLKKAPSSHWAVTLAASTLSMALFILSPGNAERAALEHRHSWDFAHAPYWIAHSFYHGLTWLSTPAVLAAAFCIFLVSGRQEGTEAAKSRSPQWLGAVSLCFMLFILCECTLVEIATGTGLWPSRGLVSVCVLATVRMRRFSRHAADRGGLSNSDKGRDVHLGRCNSSGVGELQIGDRGPAWTSAVLAQKLCSVGSAWTGAALAQKLCHSICDPRERARLSSGDSVSENGSAPRPY